MVRLNGERLAKESLRACQLRPRRSEARFTAVAGYDRFGGRLQGGRREPLVQDPARKQQHRVRWENPSAARQMHGSLGERAEPHQIDGCFLIPAQHARMGRRLGNNGIEQRTANLPMNADESGAYLAPVAHHEMRCCLSDRRSISSGIRRAMSAWSAAPRKSRLFASSRSRPANRAGMTLCLGDDRLDFETGPRGDLDRPLAEAARFMIA